MLARLHEETGDQEKALEAYRKAVAGAMDPALLPDGVPADKDYQGLLETQ